jgi:hypothetical protein
MGRRNTKLEVYLESQAKIACEHLIKTNAEVGMTEDQLEKIRACARRLPGHEKTVRVACKDGDVLQGFALFVSDAERDVVFELHSSNNPKYQSGTHYLIGWDDITDFQELS